MPFMLSKTGEVRFIPQALVDQMRKAGWSFTTQRPDEFHDAPDIGEPFDTGLQPRSDRQSSPDAQDQGFSDLRLFRMPNGFWMTPSNMAAFRARDFKGYNGPWFPQRQEDLVAFMRSDRYIKLFRELTRFLATGNDTGKTDASVIDLDGLGAGLGSGFGSSSFGAVYQAPDEDAVKEALQGFQVAVTGQLDDLLLDQAVAEYLTTHKQDFDDPNAQHDPFQAAKVIIRGSESYKDIHKLRPESENELAWVTTQQGRLRTLGLTSEQSEQLGIKLARVGASQEAAQDAGNTAFFKNTGRVAKDQRDSLKSSARAVLGLL